MAENETPSIEETAAEVAATLEEHAAVVAADLAAQGADFKATMVALEALRGSLVSQKNKIRAVVVIGLLFFLLFGLLGLQNHQNATDLRATVAAQRRLSDQQQTAATAYRRESQIVAHGQCIRLDDGRLRSRQILGDEIVLIFGTSLPGNPPRTQEQDDALERLRQSLIERATRVLPTVDCDKAAPLPSLPLSAAEKLELFSPPPIPKPLHP